MGSDPPAGGEQTDSGEGARSKEQGARSNWKMKSQIAHRKSHIANRKFLSVCQTMNSMPVSPAIIFRSSTTAGTSLRPSLLYFSSASLSGSPGMRTLD